MNKETKEQKNKRTKKQKSFLYFSISLVLCSREANKGFTLLEIIIVVALMSVIGVIGVVSFRGVQDYADVDAAANQLVTVLREARDRTVATGRTSVYGVRIEPTRYILFVGPTYSEGAPGNRIYTLPAALELYDIGMGGDNAVVFGALDGAPDEAGSTSIRVISDPAQNRVIEVFSTGVVGIAGTVTPSGTRITDTRHVHFDLGWSMQNATTLTLRFFDPPNPDVVQNISVSAYMNSDRTKFDWSGTVEVGGEPQTLRIHTHFLDAADTILSVHRDRRVNTRAVTISIDGDEIASYAADGTLQVGIFGGTEEIQ